MQFVRDHKHFSCIKTYAHNHARRACNKIRAHSSHSRKDLIATRKRNIVVIGITPPNVIATLPRKAILATTGVTCVTRWSTPFYIVPKGNTLSWAHQLTQIRLGMTNTLSRPCRDQLPSTISREQNAFWQQRLILNVGIFISKTIMMSLLLSFCNMAGLSVNQRINFLARPLKIIALLVSNPHYFVITSHRSSNTRRS